LHGIARSGRLRENARCRHFNVDPGLDALPIWQRFPRFARWAADSLEINDITLPCDANHREQPTAGFILRSTYSEAVAAPQASAAAAADSVRPAMEKRYDLFELPPAGFPLWIDSASDLSEASEKMLALPAPAPGGEYLVRDFYSGMVVDYTVSDLRGWAKLPPSAQDMNLQKPGPAQVGDTLTIAGLHNL
jgi:hypothetical protein